MSKRYRGAIAYEIRVTPEDHSDIDQWFSDPHDAERVREGLTNGNVWEWCTVELRATTVHRGRVVTESDYLGACSYPSEQAFRECAYFTDMKREARRALIANVTREAK